MTNELLPEYTRRMKPPVFAALSQRGFIPSGRGDWKQTVTPAGMQPNIIADGGVWVPDWDDEYYSLMSKMSFRKLLRLMLAHPEGIAKDDAVDICAEPKLTQRLTYLERTDIAEQVSGARWRLKCSVDNLGPTFERYVASVFLREFSCPAEWGIKLKDFPSGDLDVLAVWQAGFCYVECKTKNPTAIGEDELRQFLIRTRDLRPSPAILLVDTEDEVTRLIDGIGRMMEFGPFSARYDKKNAALGCLFHKGQYVFVTNATPSVKARLARCLRYYGRDVGGDWRM